MDRVAAIDAYYAPLIEAERLAASDGSAPSVAPSPGTPTVPDEMPVMRPGVTYVRQLPRQSGAIRPDHLGRDALGPVLIGGSQRPPGTDR